MWFTTLVIVAELLVVIVAILVIVFRDRRESRRRSTPGRPGTRLTPLDRGGGAEDVPCIGRSHVA